METISDIVREMRKDIPRVIDAKVILRNYADRIEKAAKALEANRDNWRDQAFAEASRANAAMESLQVGNAAKMREALEWLFGFGYITTDGGFHMPDAKMARNKIEEALAAPPRNCDIGTAEEQAERYMNFCRNHPKCIGCPCVGRVKYNQCEFAWLQMPYEEAKG